MARHHVLEAKEESVDLAKVLLDGVAVRISIPGTSCFLTAGECTGGRPLQVVHVQEGCMPVEPSSVFWLSGARGCAMEALLGTSS